LTARPADSIPNEFEKIEAEAKAAGAKTTEDALTYAMFPKVAPNFFRDRAKGPVSSSEFAAKPAGGGAAPAGGGAAAYVVNVNGADYHVEVRPEGTVAIAPAGGAAQAQPAVAAANAGGTTINAPVAGTILKHAAAEGSQVSSGDTIIIIESMKMELEIKATSAGKVHFLVPTGQAVQSQQPVAQVG
jgi:oxaloacetate decarboxylase alpha subunit